MGIGIALSIAGAVFQNQAVHDVVRVLPSVDRSSLRAAITGVDSTYFASLPTSDQANVLGAIAEALSSVYLIVIVAGAVTIIVSCFLGVRCASRRFEH